MVEAKHWTHVMISPGVKVKMHPEGVLSIIANHYGVTPDDIKRKDKHIPISDIRTTACAYLYLKHGMAYAAVGQTIGGRDHSTIISAVKNHHTWMGNNKPYRDMYNGMVKYVEEVMACL